jgi:hypothetical protein
VTHSIFIAFCLDLGHQSVLRSYNEISTDHYGVSSSGINLVPVEFTRFVNLEPASDGAWRTFDLVYIDEGTGREFGQVG